MSDELTLNISFSFSKNGRSVSKDTGDLSIDVTGDKWTHIIQEIGTSEEAIDLGDVAVGGMCIVHNRDENNYVEIRPGTGENDCIKLLAGDVQVFRLASAAPFAIADTAACEVEFLMLEA